MYLDAVSYRVAHANRLLPPKVTTIAESVDSDYLNEDNSVSVDLDTTNNIWKMTVGYKKGFSAPWLKGLTAGVVLISLFIAILVMTVLVASRERKILLNKMMPPRVVKKLQRGETVVQKCDTATSKCFALDFSVLLDTSSVRRAYPFYCLVVLVQSFSAM